MNPMDFSYIIDVIIKVGIVCAVVIVAVVVSELIRRS